MSSFFLVLPRVDSISMSYPIKRFSTLCRIGGAGYRTLSRLQHTRPLRLERLFSMYTRRGRPLNPYLRGVLIDYLRKEMFPKELKVLPSEVIKGSTEDVLSRTLLRSWVRQWLTYCRWYYVTAWSPTVTIQDQDFFDAPVVNRDWRVTSVDPELVRFGLLWKLYD